MKTITKNKKKSIALINKNATFFIKYPIRTSIHIKNLKKSGLKSLKYISVFKALCKFANPKDNHTIYKSRAGIAQHAKVSESTVTRAIKYFKQAGWIYAETNKFIGQNKQKNWHIRLLPEMFLGKKRRASISKDIHSYIYKYNPFNNLKKFSIDNFWPSKKNQTIMHKKGITSYMLIDFYLQQAKDLMKFIKSKNQTTWNIQNANYFFEKFIRHEIDNYQKAGARYIPALKRYKYKLFQKAKSIPQQAKTYISFKTSSFYRFNTYQEQMIDKYKGDDPILEERIAAICRGEFNIKKEPILNI